MATVTADKIISTAKSLVGKDSDKGCDIMKWYGNYDTTVNAVACCCAGQMYLFNKAGALDMIPGGKTASCGIIAVNFLNAGQLYGPKEVKPGDLVIFSWSGKPTKYGSRLKAKGCKSLDHIELCIAVGGSTITTIGANNGGTECDDFRVRTRYKSNISCCCRPKYAKSTNEVKEEMIKYGAHNTATLAFKKQLITLYNMGIIKTKVDNSNGFGAGTLKAVKEAQKAGKVTVDGIVGEKTINAIYHLINDGIRAKDSKIANAKKALS